MPIKRELRWFYPIDWPEISRRVRFERAGGVCEGCGRPHGETVRCLPDGRWFDAARHTWRNGREGGAHAWPAYADRDGACSEPFCGIARHPFGIGVVAQFGARLGGASVLL